MYLPRLQSHPHHHFCQTSFATFFCEVIIICVLVFTLFIWSKTFFPQHIILCAVSAVGNSILSKEAAFTFPAGVKLFSPSTIQVVHLARTRSLNGLLKQTSSGWRTLVNPPGMTMTSVFVWHSAHFTGSARWKLFFRLGLSLENDHWL